MWGNMSKNMRYANMIGGTNMRRRINVAMAAVFALTMWGGISVEAAHDENLNVYTLNAVVVTADRTKNKFGDTITEQSYYRTGGDVKVITREEIEKRHYTDVSEAIKRIPGITFQNPGYRGGEYGYQFYNNGVSINGDTRVVVLVDGRRVDNAASTRVSSKSNKGSKATGVNLDQITNVENIDKIEVIKGPGASEYGADATGGVINIITRKGAKVPQGSIDLATGSWDKHHYAISFSGSAEKDPDFHYFISANRDMSGDTKYKDATTKVDATLDGSRWKEDGINIRLDKDFGDKKNVKVWYNYRAGKDGYPIGVPNQKYMNPADWGNIISRATVGFFYEKTHKEMVDNPKYKKDDPNNKEPKQVEKVVYDGITNSFDMKDDQVYQLGNRLAGDASNPGYHNLFALDGNYGSFSRFKNKDFDIVYTFDKDNELESFVRFYSQQHRLSNRDVYHWFYATPEEMDQIDKIIKEKNDKIKEENAPLVAENKRIEKENEKLKKENKPLKKLKDLKSELRFNDTTRAIEAFHQKFPNGATGKDAKQWIKDHLAPFPGQKEDLKKWIEKTGGYAIEPTSWYQEDNQGVQLQVAKRLGNQDIIASLTYDSAYNYTYQYVAAENYAKSAHVNRNSILGFVQDKIHVTDKWDITPALRYSYYTDYVDNKGVKSGGNVHSLTYAVNTQMKLTDDTNVYAGVVNIFRPLRKGDYVVEDKINRTKLEDEKGTAYTVGINHKLGDSTVLAVNYNWTHMSNSIATFKASDGNSYVTNAKEDKQSFNVTLDQKIGKHITLSASYSHMNDKWKSRDGEVFTDANIADQADINANINKLRPQNHYALNLSYENGAFYSGLLMNWYTGCSPIAFTSSRFLVIDWNANYELSDNLSAYVAVNNLTNVAYETSYNSWMGLGGTAMPGRSVMVGTKYKF